MRRSMKLNSLLSLVAAFVLSVTGCSMFGPTGPEPAPNAKSAHMTTFLRNNASKTSHVLMSKKLTDADREELIAFNKASGYNVLYIYLANEGDYGGKSVAYTSADKEFWRKWLGKVRDSGSRPIIWMCADDSPGLSRRTDAQWEALVKQFHADCGDLVSEWVTGLECNERWLPARTQGLTKMLKRVTGLPVGVHCTGISAIDWAAGADSFYLQTGFGKSAGEIASQVKQAKAKFGKVYLAEYHKSGETEAAKLLGDAGLAAGADGIGNGCHPTKAQAPPGDSTGTPSDPKMVLQSIQWSGFPQVRFVAPEIETWPTDTVEGKKCVATLHIDGKKVEWVPAGRQGSSVKNAINPNDKKYFRPDLKPGMVVQASLVSVDGKRRSNALPLVWQ